MKVKNIAVSVIIAEIVILILILIVVINGMVNMVIPSDLSKYGGMRSEEDPVMMLFFFYPFVVAFAAAIIFDVVKGFLKGTPLQKGLMFGALLLVVMTIPSLYVMITSMTWPVAFSISTVRWEIISLPLMGILFTKIWKLS
ncbi:MAG: hypothetical protein NTZ37_09040 [Methanoregula sp.]|jgi:hypothetical protein|nr:hypothetical protein [Methanoregula sp.]